ncbi:MULTISPECIES: FtsK/SpoIIIE domain-containing protein [unclassified Leifsonia]|uniref:FtsK/SpoIIIE domain-containing protein n=1 Tax=unclassified Leifsonia TaxID=2663824 RepID=UPI0008A7547A|nr:MULTISPECIES: FtsK/SpoIIIE domain-containing protein [unclassified Leifsonia]SEH56302.1 DNA segregation ATPase FtsK/SpoIIIE, S-DNA-T family [Leifsonia sp. CL154]SFL22709.1 DNA segregation ATPase FtsK/SpoIIIE, S-DNA-T family [Leifsonia sp. CL147]
MRVKLGLRRAHADDVDIVVTADATATVGDVAWAIVDSDPTLRASPDPADRLTLMVSPPESDAFVELVPETPIGEAAIGSGFNAVVVRCGTEAPSGGSPQRGAAAATVRVMTGPARGAEFLLPAGNSTIGRVAGNDVVLEDPLVSKRHARVEVGPGGVDVIDLNSANGILVDGGLVSRVRLSSGQSVILGDSEIRFTAEAPAAAEATPQVLERGGVLRFNRSPRVEGRYPGQKYPSPEIPGESEPQVFPWVMMVAPAVMGAVMFAVTRNPLSLAFIALAPMMMLGSYVAQSSGVKRKLKISTEKFELQLEDLEARVLAEVPREQEARRRESPSVAEIYADALQLGPMLWTRRPEHWNFLDVRLGLGTMPSRNTVTSNDFGTGLPAYTRAVEELKARAELVSDVPLVENLHLAGALGVCGPGTSVADTVRALIVQYAGLHSPAELTIAAILGARSTAEFEWLKWLPHTSSPQSSLAGVHLADSTSTATSILNALEELIETRIDVKRRADSARGAHDEGAAAVHRGAAVGSGNTTGSINPLVASLVVVIDNEAPVDRARLAQVLEYAADANVYPIWMAHTVEALPAACRTFVDVSAGLDVASVGFVRLGMTVPEVRVEGVSAEYARILARRLAPVVDASAVVADSSDLPRSVSMLTLVDADLAADPHAAVERWTQNNSIHDRSGAPAVARKRAGTLRAIVGQGSPDAMHLDLRTQGPHALVGGTTGSGKSEFLQAWVLGMAAEYSPDRVTFLFVDYKGGSAFAECVRLPHCVGLVTDLSPHLVRRALTSLRAELRHREHLLNRKKAKDLIELEKRGDPECPPALILVIDEFAALVGEVPEFVDGVVDIAQRGRSLGIHLIMATQRPAGVIKDNLRANTNLRVALRVADENDSVDVVGDPVAASFDPSIPGRGIAKTGPGRLIPFQSGYAGGWTSGEPDPAVVKISELRFGAEVQWEPEQIADPNLQVTDLGPNDQVRLVENLIAAAGTAEVPAPRRPWLDELPAIVDLLALPQSTDTELMMAMIDRPEQQLQTPASFFPDRDGHMAVFGTSGAGKSVVLRTLGVAAGLTPAGGPVHVYGLDFGTGTLRMLEALPHVGSVVSGDDHERVTRLLRTVKDMLDARSRRYSEVNAGDIVEYRRLAGRPDEPRVLLLLDGFPAFKDEYDTGLGRSTYYNMFLQLLTEGRPLGMHVVFTADRATAVPTAVSSNIQRRVVLRLADENSYFMFDVPKDILDAGSPPGRAIVDGYEAQIAVAGGSPNVAEQSKAVERVAAQLAAFGRAPAPKVGQLPRELRFAELPAAVADRPVLGVQDATLQPTGFEPYGSFLVAGPPSSGKSNALVALAQSTQRWRPDARLFFMGTKRSPIKDALPWLESATNPDSAAELAGELAKLVVDEEVTNHLVIVIDNVADFQGGVADAPMTELVKLVNRSDHLLLTDGDVSTLSAGWGLIGEVKAARRGIVLMPDTFDGDAVFKVPFPRIARNESPVGRGFYVNGAQVQKVQVPLAE